MGGPGAAQLPAKCGPNTAHRTPLILAADGQEVHSLRTNAQVRQGQWVALSEVSAALRLALLASEDQRFTSTAGSIGRPSQPPPGNLAAPKTRGASTITMQLAGLLG